MLFLFGERNKGRGHPPFETSSKNYLNLQDGKIIWTCEMGKWCKPARWEGALVTKTTIPFTFFRQPIGFVWSSQRRSWIEILIFHIVQPFQDDVEGLGDGWLLDNHYPANKHHPKDLHEPIKAALWGVLVSLKQLCRTDLRYDLDRNCW